MARNSSGTYSLPASVNPVTTATTITSAWANTTLPDIAAEITDSLSRSGEGAMLAPLRVPDGSLFAPSVTFDSDQNTGLYRSGADQMVAVAGGTAAAAFASGALTAPGTMAVTGTLAVTGATTLTGALTANGAVTASAAVSLGSTLAVTGASTFTGAVAVNGGTSTNIAVGAANPISTTGFSNTLTALNLPKAWAVIDAGGGACAVTAGFNVASAAADADSVDITLATALAGANGAVVVTPWATALNDVIPHAHMSSAGVIEVRFWDVSAGGWTNMLGALAYRFSVVVFGAQ